MTRVKGYLKTFATIWILLFVTLPGIVTAQRTITEPYKKGSVIVKYKDSKLPQERRKLVRSHTKASFSSYVLAEGKEIWNVPKDLEWKGKKVEIQSFIDNLNQLPEVEYAEPDYEYGSLYIPNDPNFDKQWALQNTGQNGGLAGFDLSVVDVWDKTRGNRNIIAGVIDTGIDYMHEDLVDNIWQNLDEDADGDGHTIERVGNTWQLDPGDLDGKDDDGNGYVDDLIGWDFVNNDNNPFDDNGHGTHIAGVIGAKGDNGIGIAGINWEIQLMALKAFDKDGSGSLSSILPALEYARKKGVRISNNSWGGGAYSQALFDEISMQNEESQFFVTAAGNSGSNNSELPAYPASFDLENIIAVGASNSDAELASYSNYGITNVDIVAPGTDIYSTLPNNAYGSLSGTSMAASFVSGGLALLIAEYPDRDLRDIRDLMISKVQSIGELVNLSIAGGILDIAAALKPSSVLCPDWMNAPTGYDEISTLANDGPYLWAVMEDSLIRFNKNQCTQSTTHTSFYSIGETANHDDDDDDDDDDNGGHHHYSYGSYGSHSSQAYFNTIAVSEDGRAWVGTNRGVGIYDGFGWQNYDMDNSSLPSNKVYAIAIDKQGNAWIGTDAGVAWFDGTNWTIYDKNNSSLPHNRVHDIEVDKMNNVWIGTEGGLLKYTNGSLSVYTKYNSGLPDSRIRAIAAEDNGNVWLGTHKGLVMYDCVNWQVYNPRNSDMPLYGVRSLEVDAQGNKWMACFMFTPLVPSIWGLVKFDGRNWTKYKTNNSELPHNTIYSIDVDESDNVWVGTQNGIGVFFASSNASFERAESEVCEGNQVSFMNTSTGSSSFQWYVNGSLVGSNADLDYTFSNPGLYNVCVIAQNAGGQSKYAEDIYVHPIPKVDLGPDITECANAIILHAGMDGLNYQWTDGNGIVVGDGMKYTVTRADTYTLMASNVCGFSDMDMINISITPGCVWAGDVNADGEVNMIDFLWLGQVDGETGSSRSNASTDYASQSSSDWSGSFASQNDLGQTVNHKHGDADGDGEISAEEDGDVVLANINSVHSAPVFPASGGVVASLQAQLGNKINGGSEQIVNYVLNLSGANDTDLDNVYGIAFELEYQFTSTDANLNDASTWYTNTESQILNSFTKRKAYVGMTATDGLNRTGKGAVADIDIIATIEDIQGGGDLLQYVTLSASVSNLVVLDKDGNYLPMNSFLTNSTATVQVPIEPPTEEDEDDSETELVTPTEVDVLSGLNLYPNPCTTQASLAFEAERQGTGTLMIRSLDGRLVNRQAVSFYAGQNQIQLFTSGYTPGLYLVELEVESKRYVKKMQIMRSRGEEDEKKRD